MNPVEHFWKGMKDILKRDFTALYRLGNSEGAFEESKSALNAAWVEIPQEKIDSLVDSVPRRVAALRSARGWYTRY